MKRRDFLVALTGLALWPSFAKEERRKPVIGFLSSRTPGNSARIVAAFRSGLAEAGYRDGQDATIAYRWAEGDYERLPALANEIVALDPAVMIAAGGEPSALAAKAASAEIPTVFSVGGDPVKIGLVKSLNRPGGSMTGISLLATELEAKRIGILHELVPRAKLLGVLVDRDFEESGTQVLEVTRAARDIEQPIEIVCATNDDELTTAFAQLKAAGAEALLVCASPFFDTRRAHLVAFEAQRQVPAIYQFRDYAAARRPDELRNLPARWLPADRTLCRSDPQRHVAVRASRRSTDSIRIRHQREGRSRDGDRIFPPASWHAPTR